MDERYGNDARTMSEQRTLTRANLKTPKAAAIAGILFSILLILALWLLRISVPDDPQESGAWLKSEPATVALAVNLIPFAGIAFLWFNGALRDHLGERDDKFFATVFFGSGLLFLAMLFAAAAIAGALVISFGGRTDITEINSATFHFARAAAYNMMNVYAVKMAGVFMITTSTLAIYTGFVPRWLSILGYTLASLLLFGSYYLSWSFVVFPLWVLVMSIHISMIQVRGPRSDAASVRSGLKCN